MLNFSKGVNLGGWLSQYKEYDHAHFRSFIIRRDIEQIASWGFDHIRLPVDYPILEADESPGVYREDGFAYIDACFEWCEAQGLGIVFDLHHAPGFTFNNALQAETMHLNTLFSNEDGQQRFIQLWEAIIRRYKDARIPVIFELLNEVVLPDSEPWNILARRTLHAIRAIAPACQVMIGGNHNNAASELKNLDLVDDPHVCYTFHFYEPLLFTHQKAPWVQVAVEYDQELSYPGEYLNLQAFLARAPQYHTAFDWQVGRLLDRELMRIFLQPALDFVRKTGRDLYCGEFGVIEYVNPISRQNWHADLVYFLRQHKIGWGVWTYKQLNFGLVDAYGQVVDPALLDILRKG